ncbi:agamous-like MADS-box protein AGL80 [Glycine soja]|uniref:agamous-like MADS-box protein AGL80 n=1 Tax=Glycine soja TaxID=3848 RepID=UPI0010408DE6|nr:agamous-like MADS-box protein AGL80 [Glycine soja]
MLLWRRRWSSRGGEATPTRENKQEEGKEEGVNEDEGGSEGFMKRKQLDEEATSMWKRFTKGKKVQLAFIANDSARKLTCKKRKKGLLKKVDELSTLCGINACAIVYSPNDPEPEVWPSHWGVHRVLEKFTTMPELEQSKKMVNQESFTAQRIQKGNEQMMKLMKDNREKELTLFMFQCLNAGRVQPNNNVTEDDLNVFSSMIDQNLKDLSERMEALKVNEMTPNIDQSRMEIPTLNYGHGSDINIADPMQSQWFMDHLLNCGDGDETLIMPPFDDANLQLQTDFMSNLLP